MGVGFEDYDNDGWPDIFIDALSKQKYALFHNERGKFAYVSGPAGIAGSTVAHSGWGAKFVDLDNDGWKDLFIGQGHVMDNIQITQPDSRYLEAPLVLRNTRGKFVEVSNESGSALERSLAARGVAFGDLDNDGFEDIVISCNSGLPLVLRNTGNGNHWLTLALIGTRSNRDGIGAQVQIVAEDGSEQSAMISTSASYLSASDKRVHFGLGANRVVKQLTITWPSGVIQRLQNERCDQFLQVREPEK
jgi:hypothetical protein